MDEQIILAVDDKGEFSGEYIPKMAGHIGKGRRHLAISVLLYNSKGEVLLQKRKHKIFDKIWDVTAATHPLHKPDGSDETLEDAARRCLKQEYGISEKMPLKNLGFFNYFAKYNEYCENEHCAILTGEYDGPIDLNPEAGYSYKWIKEDEFLKDIKENPENYSPWAIEAAKIIRGKRKGGTGK